MYVKKEGSRNDDAAPCLSARAARRISGVSPCVQVMHWPCLIDLEGTGFSARVTYLLHSGRPLLLASRSLLTWYDEPPFPEPIRPWDHFIPIRSDLSDLEPMVAWVFSHPAEAYAIARRAQQLARRHLNPHFAGRYLLQAVQRFPPHSVLRSGLPARGGRFGAGGG
jgi:hypothetical protein